MEGHILNSETFELAKGESKLISILVTDQDRLVDLSLADQIAVSLNVNNVFQKAYSKNSISSYGKVQVNSLNKSIIDVIVEDADSSLFSLGKLSADIMIELTDANFAGNERTLKKHVELGRVVTGYDFDLELVPSIGPITDLVASPDAQGEVDLTWSVPSTSGGSAISHYLVQYKETTANNWTVGPTVQTNSASVTGLDSGTSYDFRVILIDDNSLLFVTSNSDSAQVN